MKCSEARTFLSQVGDREESITPISAGDLNYLSSNGYVQVVSAADYEKSVSDVARLSQLTTQLETERPMQNQAAQALLKGVEKEHSFMFHLEGQQQRDELEQKVQGEATTVSSEEAELNALEANVNQLIQEKSVIDRLVPYGGGYVALTGLGSLVLNDLSVRNYRVSDEEFSDFLDEIKSTYAELRGIADKASSYVSLLRSTVSNIEDAHFTDEQGEERTPSLFWSVAIGLGKLQGDVSLIGQRVYQSIYALHNFNSTIPNKLMAAEIMTALSNQDIQSLATAFSSLDHQVRGLGVPKELSAGVAATILAGRRYDGTYPTDRYGQLNKLTASCEAAAILAVMNVPTGDLTQKFLAFRSMFSSWGFMASEDTEISSAFLAIGELNAEEVADKMKYIVEQLRNYLEYPLVAAAILASIPVFEAHEVLDLMEKAVTLLSGYVQRMQQQGILAVMERSELVALAVRMIHGVRNEIVSKVDPTAKVANTPVQFTYGMHPGFFYWYSPVIIAHSAYYSTFSGMGGFHPAHSHGIGGFAG